MKNYLIFLLLSTALLCPDPATGQIDQNLTSIEIMGSQGVFESGFLIRPEGRYRQTKGSPYLYDEWKPGRVWMSGDTLPIKLSLRYNIYGNEMQFLYEQDTFAISNPFSVRGIELDGRYFEFLAFMHHGNENMAWFEVLIDGPYRLLSWHGVRLDAGREPMTPYHPQNEYNRFVHVKKHYLQTPDNPDPMEAPDIRKEWVRLAGERGGVVKEFIRDERIRLHREDDLIRLVMKLND